MKIESDLRGEKKIRESGDLVVNKGIDFSELGRVIVSLFFVFYGFFALSNPNEYPILGRVLSETQYWELSRTLDPLLGIAMMAFGAYVLFVRE